MTQIIVERKGPTFMQVHLDGQNIPFVDGRATLNIGRGMHALQWFVRGAPGTRYSIAITEPDNLEWEHKGRLGPRQKEMGVQWIDVE